MGKWIFWEKSFNPKLSGADLGLQFYLCFFSVTEKGPPDLTNFTANTKDIASSESEKECSVLTNFTMKTEDRATFEWENGKEATANLVKEMDECIYR